MTLLYFFFQIFVKKSLHSKFRKEPDIFVCVYVANFILVKLYMRTTILLIIIILLTTIIMMMKKFLILVYYYFEKNYIRYSLCYLL